LGVVFAVDDLTKILLTSALTVVTGVIVLVLGQVIVKFLLEPVGDLKRTLAKIHYAFIFHDQAILTPTAGDTARCDKAAEALRDLASELFSKTEAIPLYGTVRAAMFCRLPKHKDALSAAVSLRALSNSVHMPDRTKNFERLKTITRLLGLRPVE